MHPDPAELRSLPLFASLGEEDLAQISQWLEIRSAEPGQRVVLEGASGYSFFVIQDGTADANREGQVIGSLGPGDFFGERAILDSGRRMADVVATSPMRLFAMFGTNFRQLQARMPDVARRIEEVAQAR